MRKLFTFLFLSICISSMAAGDLKPEHKAAILTKFVTEVKYNFVHLDRIPFDWDSLCRASFPRIVNTKNDSLFLCEMQILCAALKDGHTRIFRDNIPGENKKWIRPLPIKTKRIGGQVYVTDVLKSDIAEKGVREGTELVSIDDVPVLEYAARELLPFFSSSTPQWTDYAPFINFELTKRPGEVVSEITFKNSADSIFTLTLGRLVAWDMAGNGRTLEFKRVPGNLGYLKVKSFQQGEFDTEVFEKLYKDSISNTSALIIDIRDNQGGNSAYADLIIRTLSADSIPQPKWKTPKYIAAHASWNMPAESYIEIPGPMASVSQIHPQFQAYSRPVVLLVNAGTFSSAENFALLFKGINRGVVIGMPTGGSSGNPIVIDLGEGYMAQICTRHEWMIDGSDFNGIGIIPDIIVDETSEIFRGKDVVLDTAIEYLRRN